MSYWPTSSPSDWLYTYSPAGGWPTGWNLDHPLAEHRDVLQHCGVSSRLQTADTDPFFVWPGGIPSGLEGTAAAIDFVNPRYPRLGVRVSRDLFLFVMHFWFGNLDQRVRPSVNDLWSTPQLRSLRADGTLRSYANADFLGPWNRLPGPVQVAMRDCGLTEWTVGSPDDPGGYPQVVRADTMPTLGASAWVLENQGRAIPVTIQGVNGSGDQGFNTLFNVVPPDGCQLYAGDSGAPIFVEVGDTLALWGHVFTAFFQPPHGFHEFPKRSEIEAFAVPMATVAPPVTWEPARQTTLEELEALIASFQEGVAGL